MGGDGKYVGDVDNTASIYAAQETNGATFEVNGAITGTGTLQIDAGANLKLDDSVSGQSVIFDAPAGNRRDDDRGLAGLQRHQHHRLPGRRQVLPA